MSKLSLSQVIAQIRLLPSLPAAVTEALRDLRRDNADISALARKIGKDQALSASVLRLANSSFYGMSGRITSLQSAALVLGTHSLRSLVIAAGLPGQFAASHSQWFDWRAFWQHAFAAAMCARMLAGHCAQDPEAAFIAALAHDIGRLALVTLFPADYEQVFAHSKQHSISLVDAERLLLGFDHAHVGGALAQRWKLPSPIRHAIEHHHQPDILSPLADLLRAADAMTEHPDSARIEPATAAALSQVWARLGLDAQQIESCAAVGAAGAREIAAMLLKPA